jgi:hypothetical protein
MGRVLIYLRMEIFILVSMLTASLVALDNINGQAEQLILENSEMVLNMGKVSGRKTKGRIATNMTEHFSMI